MSLTLRMQGGQCELSYACVCVSISVFFCFSVYFSVFSKCVCVCCHKICLFMRRVRVASAKTVNNMRCSALGFHTPDCLVINGYKRLIFKFVLLLFSMQFTWISSFSLPLASPPPASLPSHSLLLPLSPLFHILKDCSSYIPATFGRGYVNGTIIFTMLKGSRYLATEIGSNCCYNDHRKK